MADYISRDIDQHLVNWKNSPVHKPLLLRGARQVGKSSAVQHLGLQFKYFAEVNFEEQKGIATFFDGDLDIQLIVSSISNYIGVPIVPGQTLLFLDEIQACPNAIISLRFFREKMPGLHVVAAGSLLEFALQEIPTFGVGRIHSIFMYPMTFDEFLGAVGMQGLLSQRRSADSMHPLPLPFHEKLVEQFRIYLMVGGMPEAVATWRETKDFLQCLHVHQDIILTYEDDFNKYKRRVNPNLLRITLRGVCHQIGKVLSFSQISTSYRSAQFRDALALLSLAGIITPVVATSGNGLPLDAEANELRAKYLFLDTGLLLAILHLDGASSQSLIQLIMTGEPKDLVNKGGITEMLAGLELMRHQEPIQRPRMFFWEKTGKSVAEVDYLTTCDAQIVPVEIKAGTQGGMKSLWMFMSEKHIARAIRCSLENFGQFDNTDADGALRHVDIIPLYAIAQLR